MLAVRNSKPTSELDLKSAEIGSKLLKLSRVIEAHTISTYLHTGSEVRTSGIVDWALSNGKRVIVPISDKATKRLIFSEIKSRAEELERGTYGILEPKPQFRRPVPLEDADVALIPAIAWDKMGFRIGYGKGYYDRSINSLKTRLLKIGLAYEFQFIQRVPRSRYDRKVDAIVTERRIIKTAFAPKEHFS